MKMHISMPILVEGRYDKNHLQSIVDAHILCSDGFGIFREREKRELLRRLAMEHGLIVLTDSDGAGLVIRNYLNSLLPRGRVHHLYIPQVAGKERRKAVPSKEGYLGVEGIDAGTLRALLAPFADDAPPAADASPLTKADFYADGYSGRPDSASRREALARALRLPANLSSNAILEAINLLRLREAYERFTHPVQRKDL